MADEILKRDANFVTVIGAITDDAAQEIRMVRVDPTTGRILASVTGVGTGSVTSVSVVTANGVSGSVANPTTTPAITLTLGDITPSKVNGLSITTSTGTLAIANGKIFTVSNTLTLAGTDSTVMTFPTTSASIARTDAGQTFTGTQVIGALTVTTVNGNTFTTGTGVLTIAASKTLTVSNSITLAGTDGKGINVGASTSGKILIGDGSNMVLSTPTYPTAAGTSGNVMTSDGTNWISSTPASSSIPKIIQSTIFEDTTIARYGSTASGAGSSNTIDTSGLAQRVGGVTNAYNSLSVIVSDSTGAELGNPAFSTQLRRQASAGTETDFQTFYGLGTLTIGAGGITYTAKHIGFKIVQASSGAVNLFATQANGTTETASSSLTTVADQDVLELLFQVNGSSSVDYYWRKNGGSLSSATNLTTNMPSLLSGNLQFGFWRGTTGDGNAAIFHINSASYQR